MNVQNLKYHDFQPELENFRQTVLGFVLYPDGVEPGKAECIAQRICGITCAHIGTQAPQATVKREIT